MLKIIQIPTKYLKTNIFKTIKKFFCATINISVKI